MEKNMSQSIIAGKAPMKMKLEKGKKYFWCACGKSSKQPFCDGSHQGTGIMPKSFNVEKDGEYFICMCKKTKTAPFCDGTHKTLG